MKREIKFRAWIPELSIMLNEITLYGNRQMGYDEYEFKEQLPKDYILDYDYECVVRNFINTEGDEDFEKLTPVLLGEDWIWLDENDFEPMQYSGINDKKGKEIYEGDIFKIGAEKEIFEVKFEHGCFMAFCKGKQFGLIGELQFCFIDVIGYFFENPELLEAVA